MFINRTPNTGKNGDIRYFVFIGDDFKVVFQKVKCVLRRFDTVNEIYVTRCEVLESFKEDYSYGDQSIQYTTNKDGKRYTTVDCDWHLQESKEDAKKLLILMALNEGSSYSHIPVWKL